MATLIDWPSADADEEGFLAPAVEALQAGKMVACPSGNGYALVVDTRSRFALQGLAARAAAIENPITLAVAELSETRAWGAKWPQSIERISRRSWPGSLCISLPVSIPANSEDGRELIAPHERLVVNFPAHRAMQRLMASLASLAFIELPDLGRVEEVLEHFPEIEVIVDDGDFVHRVATIVRVEEESWSVERSGSTSQDELVRNAARWLIFICTGNTCRSPMAEAICKQYLARWLGCSIPDLIYRGFWVASAGVSADLGSPASPDAVDYLQEWKIDLGEHRSRPASAELVMEADELVAMTRTHLVTLISRFPGYRGALRLLCGIEGDLDDPIGGGPEVYAACAQTILRHVDRLITEINPA